MARAPPGRVPEARPTTASRRRSTCPNDATEDDVARRLPPGVGAGLPGHHGLPRRVQGRAGAEHRRRRRRTKGRPRPAPLGQQVVKPRPHSLDGRDLPDRDPDRHGVHHGQRERRAAIRSRCSSRSARRGSDTMAVAEALGRLISLVLRLPSPLSAQRRLEEVVSQLSRIGGGQPTGFGADKILSLPDALASTLAEHIGEVKDRGPEAPSVRGPRKQSATSARSAGRRRSCTRKAARSASRAASTSADQPSDGGAGCRPLHDSNRLRACLAG